MLAIIVRLQSGKWDSLKGGNPWAALALFAYAVPFSFAYLRIGAAVGALVLFGVVQLTMIGYGVFRGERPAPVAWVGFLIATLGLSALTVPSATSPDLIGLLLMAIAGSAWTGYSVLGKKSSDPIAANATSFLYSFPLAAAVSLVTLHSMFATARGALLAIVSGAVTSGLGYAIWYRALMRLRILQAAVAQLTVPIIASFGAIAVLNESINPRLVVCSIAVLGGVALVVLTRSNSGKN